MLLVVGRDDVTVEVALHGVSTPLAVTEWRRLPAEVRQALPTAEDFRATVAQTVHDIQEPKRYPFYRLLADCASVGRAGNALCGAFASVALPHYVSLTSRPSFERLRRPARFPDWNLLSRTRQEGDPNHARNHRL